MTRSIHRSPLEVEEHAVAYLQKLPPRVAFATALMAESFLGQKWSVEQSEMLQRGDTRKAFPISDDDFQRIREARTFLPPDVEVDLIAMHHVISLVSGFTLDLGWKTASAIAWRAAVLALWGERQQLDEVWELGTSVPTPKAQ
jgi:hypothetical protein